MMKRIIYIIFTGLALLGGTGCDKYLDVKPVDKFLEDHVYNNETSIRAALNGIYLNLGKSDLYGQHMTATTLDVMAQYYNCASSAHPFYSVGRYDYPQATTQAIFTSIWGSAYRAILNLNLFIQKVDATNGILSAETKSIILGEAYGMRAYISFDMLRLFGPIYAKDSTSPAIPYSTSAGTETKPLLSPKEIVALVRQDLEQAERYLASDPVITKGVEPLGTITAENFLKQRNHRFNYYAVLALKARVALYANDRVAALAAAQAVMGDAGSKFPWSASNLTSPGISNPDRIFSSEVLFGVENLGMYSSLQSGNFAAALTTNILIPLPAQLNSIYENYTNDYRFRSHWVVDATSNRTEKSFFKFADVLDKTLSYRFFMPLLRMSEMYLIAAESTDDPAQALGYLNTFGEKRGLPALAETVDIPNEISKAYQKEFWGEGQTFFYYKRTNKTAIRNGNGTGTISMDINKYRVPLPVSETQYR